jgi:glycosyltransferase involved in cell wall biosynthesis
VLTGYVYGPLLEALYSHAAVFVLPSALEGLPLTLLEAASYGVPVVASDIPPHLEVLGSEGPGRRLFASGDELGLAAALDRALSQPAGERLGAARLRQRVLDRYDWDRATLATEAVYRIVVGRLGDVIDLRVDEIDADVDLDVDVDVDVADGIAIAR